MYIFCREKNKLKKRQFGFSNLPLDNFEVFNHQSIRISYISWLQVSGYHM
jgi:hypothetical protein